MRTVNLDEITLSKGAHSPDSQFCVMELAAYIAEEKWTDHPKCVSRVIAAFLRSWNDALDDADRQMLKPYATKALNTTGSKKQEAERAWMAIDWLVRECAPAFLRLAGLRNHAISLETLASLTGTREATKAQPTVDAARAAAWAAAGAKLRPAVKALQASALKLLDRMIAVTS
jgi:hypothetical protein